MKKILVSILVMLAFHARATLIVHDPGLTAKTAADEVVNFAKWAKTEVDALNTELNTLHSYENSILQLSRMGDPSALRNLPGVSTVAELYGTGQQLMYTYQRWQNYFNPQGYQGTLNSILGSYRLPTWNGFETLSGYSVPPTQGLYQFDVSRWNMSNDAQTQLQQLEQQREKLQKQRDQTLRSLQSATDQSAVQKYTAELSALNAGIQEIAAHEANVLHQTQLKGNQIGAGQNIYQNSSAERQRAADLQAIDAGLNQLPLGNLGQPPVWGSN